MNWKKDKLAVFRFICYTVCTTKTDTVMSVSIRCGVKVDGVRKESKSQCQPPVYTKKGKLVKGCPLWNECIEELKNWPSVDVIECDATKEEIESGHAFEDLDGNWKIFRKM